MGRADEAAHAAVRKRCVFTTHTPVPAGHDRFPNALVASVLGDPAQRRLEALGQAQELNLTDLALRSVRFVNGVAMRHGEVSNRMFPAVSDPLDHQRHPPRHLGRAGVPGPLRPALSRLAPRRAFPAPCGEDPAAARSAGRTRARSGRCSGASTESGAKGFREEAFTIGFARRSTAYKRSTLLFHDLERLRELARAHGPIQLVFAGKAHPNDGEGKQLIRRVFEAGAELGGAIPVAYLPDYDMATARFLVSGCDLWLNNPVPPLEASGTSGMKAALNGVPSLSVLDGWWVEGHVEGVTGWSIGNDGGAGRDARRTTATPAMRTTSTRSSTRPCSRFSSGSASAISRSCATRSRSTPRSSTRSACCSSICMTRTWSTAWIAADGPLGAAAQSRSKCCAGSAACVRQASSRPASARSPLLDHLVLERLAQGRGQPLRAEARSGDRRRPEPEGADALAPVDLVEDVRHDHLRNPGAGRRGGGAGAAVVDDGRHAREEPRVRDRADREHALRERPLAEPRPALGDQRATADALDRAQEELCRPGRIGVRHASEAEVHGGPPRCEEGRELGRQLGTVQRVEAADHRDPIAQIRGHGSELGIDGEQRPFGHQMTTGRRARGRGRARPARARAGRAAARRSRARPAPTRAGSPSAGAAAAEA